ncbi:MAG: C25 family cysteine peptidase [candidate division WOR-3 bacterium]
MRKLFLLFVPAMLAAGTVRHVLELDRSQLRFGRFQGFDVVELDDGLVIPAPGRPCLPDISVTLVLPAGATVTGVTSVPVATELIPGSYRVLPCQEPWPISQSGPPAFVEPDHQVYASTAAFPSDPTAAWHTGSASGFRLVNLNLCPFEYRPALGQLRLHTRLAVTVTYEESGPRPTLTPSQLERTVAGLAELVANPEQLDRFAPDVAETDLPTIDYLVITSDRLAAWFKPFLEYKTGRGLRTEIRTTEWIERNCPGRDLQERIRNLIRDFFEHRGLTYVLLAGDNAFVPCRRIRVSVSGETGDIPTDLYYADLDYSWDSNHNNLFGEMDDSVDLYADVILGRASVDNQTEVETFIRKLKNYEENPAMDYVKRTLLPSGWLWRSLNYHGRIVNDSIANMTPSGWPDVKMENPPSCYVVADSFNHGFAFFDPAGHGNANGVYDEDGTPIYTSSLARAQTNDRRYSIMTSLACNPGDFETEDCLAENAHNAATGGCIAVMMNSRYGWGTPPSFGPSEKLCARFYDFLLKRSTFVLGTCHSHSREVYAASAQSNSLWRWCMTEFNLFADPSLDIWTEVPAGMTITAPDTILTGEQLVQVTVSKQHAPVANALVCARKGAETYAAGRTNSSGQVTLQVHPRTPGILRLTASVHNQLPAFGDVAVEQGAPEPLVILGRVDIFDSGQARANGILEPGETARLALTLHNQGTAAANSVSVVLSTSTPELTFPDSTAVFGTIPAQDSGWSNDFTIRAGPDILPGSSPEIAARIHSAEDNWEATFYISIGYPGRIVADIDTGVCALTVTCRGSVGFDTDGAKQGRGFRFPKSDTTSLNLASFCLANSADYVVDQFYTTAVGQPDRDWRMTDSLYSSRPFWPAKQLLTSSFSDAGHPSCSGVRVLQQAFGTDESGYDNFVILMYDLVNAGAQRLTGLYAGILADFDVKATDRFHDLCYTDADRRTAYLRNVNIPHKFTGVELLYPDMPGFQTCIDHSVYVYPDSGLSESMKYRLLNGTAGVTRSDRPYNWSVSVSTGPFDLTPGDTQRVAFAFVAASDSASYLETCENCQRWFNNSSGSSEGASSRLELSFLSVFPNPFSRSVSIRLNEVLTQPIRMQVFDATGRRVADVRNSTPARTVTWTPSELPAGVYLLRLEADTVVFLNHVTLVR